MGCVVGHRCGSDLTLLWLRHRPAAKAPIRPLAWELPYAMGAALKRKLKKKERKNFNPPLNITVFFFLFVFFAISWATPMAYGGSQARGPFRAVAADLRQSHSNARSE